MRLCDVHLPERRATETCSHIRAQGVNHLYPVKSLE